MCKLSIGIIVSSWFYFLKPFRNQPLIQLNLATLIDEQFNDKEIEVQVVDLRGLTKEEMCNHVPEFDLYLYSITSPDFYEIKNLVEELRRRFPRAKHIAGGFHVNIFPDECSKIFDTIVLGDGEESIIRLISDYLNGRLKNIYYPPPLPIDINKYPFPRRHYLPETAIIDSNLFEGYKKGIRGTTAQFTRGCPYRCAFCANINRRKTQIRLPALIEEEIRYLKQVYSVEGLSLKDEICLPLNPEQAIPYLKSLEQCNIIWRGQTRVGKIKPELVKLARKSGCVELALGVESASQRTLDIIKKGIKIEDIKSFIRLCKSNDIMTKLCMIIGLPGEPMDIVSITKTFLEEVQPTFVNLAAFCPYPGSEIFNNYNYFGIKYINSDWSKHAHLLYRFTDEKDTIGLPFEYYRTNRYGKTFSREEILANVLELQSYLKDRDMIY